MVDTDIQEHLAYAYVYAVASRAGFAFDRAGTDRDSEDATIKAHGKVAPTSILMSARLEVQIKAHMMEIPNGDTFPFDLPVKNYNDLRANRLLPILLVVYAMPKDKSQWLTHSLTGLTSRHCAYWHNLGGGAETTNKKRVRVHVRKSNHFCPDTLRTIMTKISKGEKIGNVL